MGIPIESDERMKKKKSMEFDCPSCGNPLRRSDNKTIRCRWCKEIIVPKGVKTNQKERVFEFELERD